MSLHLEVCVTQLPDKCGHEPGELGLCPHQADRPVQISLAKRVEHLAI